MAPLQPENKLAEGSTIYQELAEVWQDQGKTCLVMAALIPSEIPVEHWELRQRKTEGQGTP